MVFGPYILFGFAVNLTQILGVGAAGCIAAAIALYRRK
jgi:uncharacterized membrane protein YadS